MTAGEVYLRTHPHHFERLVLLALSVELLLVLDSTIDLDLPPWKVGTVVDADCLIGGRESLSRIA